MTPVDLLSSRQREILLLRAWGLTVSEAARGVGISIHTAKIHTTASYQRLGVVNAPEAWLKLGWLKPPPPAPAPVLTARQTEILRLRANGLTCKEVGVQLGLPEKGIIQHMSNIHDRLGTSSLVEAFRVMGWMSTPMVGGSFVMSRRTMSRYTPVHQPTSALTRGVT